MSIDGASAGAEYGVVPEPTYDVIPELSEADLREGCGFDYKHSSNEASPLFTGFIVKALQNPGWMTTDKYSNDPGDKAQWMSEHSTRELRELQEKTEEELLVIAKQIEKGGTNIFPDAMGSLDVVARAYQLMGEAYPNLMFYRGCEFGNTAGLYDFSSYEGIDFAPGSLGVALKHAKTGFGGTERHKTVIAMMSFADMGKAYAAHDLKIATEGEWWRNSLEIHVPSSVKKRFVKNGTVVIRRPPADQAAEERVMQSFRQKAIQLPGSK